MTVAWASTTYGEFEQETHRIDELEWAALALQPSSTVLFCGYENSKGIIDRSLAIGIKVSVLETDSQAIRQAEAQGIEVLRGSALGIPAHADRFDVAVAYYYLHEVDQTFHNSIIVELGRVARRIAVAEPGPPSDLLGSRIALLYARAKRKIGQYEEYQTLNYWRLLIARSRPVVVPVELRCANIPPSIYLHDTMRVVLDSIRIAGADAEDLLELEGIAAASDSQLLPQPRYVLLGALQSADIPDRPRLAQLEALAPAPRAKQRRNRATASVAELTVSPDPVAQAHFLPSEPVSKPPDKSLLHVFGFGKPTVSAVDERNPRKHLPKEDDPLDGFEFPTSFGDDYQATSQKIETMFAIPPFPTRDSLEWTSD